MTDVTTRDFDYVVIGSGFGGSVSALRFAEKGYRVAVLEKGRRYAAEDFPKTNWNLRKYLWMPQLGLLRHPNADAVQHVLVLHGVGVGGGSLVYANTVLRAAGRGLPRARVGPWRLEGELAPHYAEARGDARRHPSPKPRPGRRGCCGGRRRASGEDTFQRTTSGSSSANRT